MRTQIDKRLEGKGDLKEKENLMKLAKDKADIMFDFENEIVDILRSEYNKEKKKGHYQKFHLLLFLIEIY